MRCPMSPVTLEENWAEGSKTLNFLRRNQVPTQLGESLACIKQLSCFFFEVVQLWAGGYEAPSPSMS